MHSQNKSNASAAADVNISKLDIAKYIDHTLLKPETTSAEIKSLCEEAIKYNFFAVCVNSGYVEYSRSLLKGSGVKIANVVGFPLGCIDSKSKAFETTRAISMGAEEIDMVIQIGALKEKNFSLVEKDIREVVSAAEGKIVKVILETVFLNSDEKKAACEISVTAGAQFVKTSTGFFGGGATVEDITLMHDIVRGKAFVKASGGIKDFDSAVRLIRAGATRLGTSRGVALVTDAASDPNTY